MDSSCRPCCHGNTSVATLYKPLAFCHGVASRADHGAFLSALHHRLIDRISWDWARAWLHAYSHLELSERHGWPLLLLVLEAEPGGLGTAEMLQRHIRVAAAAKGDGPLADLASSIEVVQQEVVR
ncbi:MAG: hypothetical protein RLZZ516_2315 [Cyanobacteriota bacterium]|jgi:hypothetical protein